MEVVCESCGVANPSGVQFCMFCGAYLDWETRTRVSGDRPVARGAEPAVEPTEPVYAATGPVAADDQPVTIPSMRVATPVVEPPPARPAFTPVPPTDPAACPTCGRHNEPQLHFCGRCGRVLREEPPVSSPSQAAGWRRMLEDRDRRARREYRRSLPPLYRWRRVVLAVLIPALVVTGLVATGRHPLRWTQQRWWDLRGTTVAVSGVTAATSPANASAPRSDPASLVDGTEQAWSEPWNPSEEGASCGGAPGTGMVVLTFAPTRIREIDVNAGLAATNAQRPLEFRPQAIGVRFDSGPCRRFTLPDTADQQRLAVDSGKAVTSVSIGVDTTYPARADGTRVLSLTEVALRSRPS